MSTVYRSAAGGASKATELALVGKQLREAHGRDPHALTAPMTVTDVRQSALEHIATHMPTVRDRWGRERWLGDTILALPYVLLACGVLLAIGLVAGIVSVFRLNPLWIPAAFVASCVLVAGVVAEQRGAPRRWLARRPVRVDGYLELIGREERVVRLLARVVFADRAPDAAWFADVMTGAGIPSQGVLAKDARTIEVFSPEIDGRATVLHLWFQRWVDGAVLAVDQEFSVSRIELIER